MLSVEQLADELISAIPEITTLKTRDEIIEILTLNQPLWLSEEEEAEIDDVQVVEAQEVNV